MSGNYRSRGCEGIAAFTSLEEIQQSNVKQEIMGKHLLDTGNELDDSTFVKKLYKFVPVSSFCSLRILILFYLPIGILCVCVGC